MTIKHLITLSLTCLSLGALCHAEEQKLDTLMDEVNDIFKQIRKDSSLDNPARAELIKKAAELYIDSVKHLPNDIQYLFKTDLDRQVAFANYKAQIGTSYSLLCELEAAYLKNDSDAIDAIWGKIKLARKKGHKEFIDE